MAAKPRTVWAKTVSFFLKLEEMFLCALLTAMILVACLQIFMRTFFAGGFLWADPLLRYLVLWAGMFGAAAATTRGKHIALDVVSYLLPEKVKPWLASFIHLFSAMVSAALTWAAISFIRFEAESAGRVLLGISSWQWNLVFPLAFAVITVRFLFSMLTDLPIWPDGSPLAKTKEPAKIP